MGKWGVPYLVETVADTAELWGELARRANDGLEEALGDLQQVPLVLLQVLALFKPDETNKQLLSERPHVPDTFGPGERNSEETAVVRVHKHTVKKQEHLCTQNR